MDNLFSIRHTYLSLLSVFIQCFLSEYSARCRYFDPLFGSRIKNKQHLHSRHLASYLVYAVLKAYFEFSREIGISETGQLIVGLVGKTLSVRRIRN
jgi:hypothetical protein